MPTLELKRTHKPVANYYDNLARFEKLGIKHEGAVRSAFHELLESCARQFDLVPEYAIKRKGQADAKADGALLDNYGLNQGFCLKVADPHGIVYTPVSILRSIPLCADNRMKLALCNS